MLDTDLALENIDALSQSHERLWADSAGRISYLSWYNFPARFYSWIQRDAGNGARKVEEALLHTFDALAKTKSPNPLARRICVEAIADTAHFSEKVRKAAFIALAALSMAREPGYSAYSDPVRIEREISAEIYSGIVQSLPIPCVDVFLYNAEIDAYLMLLRSNAPAQGVWWMPGGRIYKGESFFEAAQRKTQIESGIAGVPIAQLGTYTTYFPDSAWGKTVTTDTRNTVILSLCGWNAPSLDKDHGGWKWVPMREAPTDPYLHAAYKEASEKLTQFGFNTPKSQ